MENFRVHIWAILEAVFQPAKIAEGEGSREFECRQTDRQTDMW